MTIVAAVGQAQILDAREAGLQATHQALNKMGATPPALAIVIAPHRFDPQAVVGGVTSLLANVPLIGFSASLGLTQNGTHTHSVIVALIGLQPGQRRICHAHPATAWLRTARG
jgi:hypothetical protein